MDSTSILLLRLSSSVSSSSSSSLLIQNEAGALQGFRSREGIDISVISCEAEVHMEELVGDACNIIEGASEELFFRIKAALADLMLATLR